MLKNNLLYRITIINAVGISFLIWAYLIGYVDKVFEKDVSHISILISILFIVGIISSFLRTIKLNYAIEQYGIGVIDKLEYDKMTSKNIHLLRMSEWLVTLGLIGNAIGFFIALDGLDSNALSTVEGTKQVASNLLSGMGVAFGSTLTGAITGLWIWVNFHVIEVATNILIADAKEPK